MKDNVVYIHSINSIPFYVGSGSIERSTNRVNRSREWFEIVKANLEQFDTEIIFRGTIRECLNIEELYIKKYKDTLCNIKDHATAASVELKTPSLKEIKIKLGQDIRVARKKRKMTSSEFAIKAGIDRSTLYWIEKGENVTIDALLNVFFILGFHIDFSNLLQNDEIGDAMIRANLLK